MRIRHFAAAILMTGMTSVTQAGSLTDCGQQFFAIPGSVDFVCGGLVGANLTNADFGSPGSARRQHAGGGPRPHARAGAAPPRSGP